jgi:isopentenyl-diphosphate Delta-isomerase
MGDELIDIYDSNNRPLNKKVMKSEAHKKGLWHRVAHVWIYNSNKEVLLQLRSKDKEVYPNVWDISVAGHISTGEREIQSAMREIEEEIGLKVKESELKLWNIRNVHFTTSTTINNEIIYLYLLKHDVDVNELKIQKEEIQKIKFFNLNELYKDLKEHPEKYTHIEYFFEMIDKIRSL